MWFQYQCNTCHSVWWQPSLPPPDCKNCLDAGAEPFHTTFIGFSLEKPVEVERPIPMPHLFPDVESGSGTD